MTTPLTLPAHFLPSRPLLAPLPSESPTFSPAITPLPRPLASSPSHLEFTVYRFDYSLATAQFWLPAPAVVRAGPGPAVAEAAPALCTHSPPPACTWTSGAHQPGPETVHSRCEHSRAEQVCGGRGKGAGRTPKSLAGAVGGVVAPFSEMGRWGETGLEETPRLPTAGSDTFTPYGAPKSRLIPHLCCLRAGPLGSVKRQGERISSLKPFTAHRRINPHPRLYPPAAGFLCFLVPSTLHSTPMEASRSPVMRSAFIRPLQRPRRCPTPAPLHLLCAQPAVLSPWLVTLQMSPSQRAFPGTHSGRPTSHARSPRLSCLSQNNII